MIFLAAFLDEYVYHFQKKMDGWGLIFAYLFTICLLFFLSALFLLSMFILSFTKISALSVMGSGAGIGYVFLFLFLLDFLFYLYVKLKFAEG